MKFKKIMSVLAGAVMLSSTVAFAAAANMYPKPFTDGAAIVYGTNAASTDMAGAIDIYDQLKDRTTGATTAEIEGEAKAIETSSQALYLSDYLNATKTTFLKSELPTVLADGIVTDDDGKELKYNLKVTIPDTEVVYGETPDTLAAPVIFAEFNNSISYELKVIFPTAANTTKLTNEKINLFGKPYAFSGSYTDLIISAGESKIILFEEATPVIINDGESVTVAGSTISAAIEDTNTASVTVDGVTESHDEGWSGKIGGKDVYFKNVVGPNVAGTSRYIELYLNSNKLTIEDDEEVVLGAESIDGTNCTLTASGNKISEIKIDVTPYDFDESIKYIKLGESIVDPVFSTIKFELASINPELEDDSRDEILIKASGERTASIKFTNKAGKTYDMNMLRPGPIRLNSSYASNGSIGDGSEYAYNATELGVGASDNLIVYNTGSYPEGGGPVHQNITGLTTTGLGSANYTSKESVIRENDYFITCSNEYTQIWKVKNIRASSSEVKIEDQGSGTTEATVVSLSATTVGATGTLTLADGSSATIILNDTGTAGITSNKVCGYLYTKSGAKIDLRGANGMNEMAQGGINKSGLIVIEEETAYNGGAFTDNQAATVGKNLTIRIVHEKDTRTGKDMQLVEYTPTGTNLQDFWTDDVGDYDNYYLSKYGTFLKQTGDTDKQVTVYYPEDAMTVGFYVGEMSAEITPGSTGAAGGQVAIVKDSEVSTVASKHLVVIGGSCVNTVAAKILGSDAPLCGADFSASTNVGAGGYIIKTVASPENEAKVAMLVAGYNAADTTNAIKRAMVIDGVATDVDSEEIFPVVA